MLIKYIFDNQGKNFMPKEHDIAFWQQVGGRLRHIRESRRLPNETVMNFLIRHDLSPRLPWGSWEKGLKGIDVQTLIEVCSKVDISPTWLLFNIGLINLRHVTKRKP